MFCRWNPSGNGDCLVQIFRLNQVKACKQLLGFSKRTIVERHLSVSYPDRRGGMDRMQWLRSNKASAFRQRAGEVVALLVRACAPMRFIEIDQTEILHHSCL